MPSKSLFVESFKSEFIDSTLGVLCISRDTLQEAKTMAAQNMECDESHILAIEHSILEHGYSPSFPITLNNHFRTIDGFSRLTACVRIVGRGDVDCIYVPFYTADGRQADYNGGTRGVSATDIQFLFKIPRHGGLLTGNSRRAAEQAIEASQMLDVVKLGGNFDKAFDPTRIQRHTSKIIREQDIFSAAYRAVCELATEMGVNPSNMKWAHWMALFCRHGVTNSIKSIARRSVIENKGTTQAQRYAAFETASAEALKLGGL